MPTDPEIEHGATWVYEAAPAAHAAARPSDTHFVAHESLRDLVAAIGDGGSLVAPPAHVGTGDWHADATAPGLLGAALILLAAAWAALTRRGAARRRRPTDRTASIGTLGHDLRPAADAMAGEAAPWVYRPFGEAAPAATAHPWTTGGTHEEPGQDEPSPETGAAASLGTPVPAPVIPATAIKPPVGRPDEPPVAIGPTEDDPSRAAPPTKPRDTGDGASAPRPNGPTRHTVAATARWVRPWRIRLEPRRPWVATAAGHQPPQEPPRPSSEPRAEPGPGPRAEPSPRPRAEPSPGPRAARIPGRWDEPRAEPGPGRRTGPPEGTAPPPRGTTAPRLGTGRRRGRARRTGPHGRTGPPRGAPTRHAEGASGVGMSGAGALRRGATTGAIGAAAADGPPHDVRPSTRDHATGTDAMTHDATKGDDGRATTTPWAAGDGPRPVTRLHPSRTGRGGAIITSTPERDGAVTLSVRVEPRTPNHPLRVRSRLGTLHEPTPEAASHAAQLVGDCCAAYLDGRMPMATLALALAFTIDPDGALAVARAMSAIRGGAERTTAPASA